MRAAQVERAADDAVRTLRRLVGLSDRGGYLMLSMAAAAAIADVEDAKFQELSFRRDLSDEVHS